MVFDHVRAGADLFDAADEAVNSSSCCTLPVCAVLSATVAPVGEAVLPELVVDVDEPAEEDEDEEVDEVEEDLEEERCMRRKFSRKLSSQLLPVSGFGAVETVPSVLSVEDDVPELEEGDVPVEKVEPEIDPDRMGVMANSLK